MSRTCHSLYPRCTLRKSSSRFFGLPNSAIPTLLSSPFLLYQLYSNSLSSFAMHSPFPLRGVCVEVRVREISQDLPDAFSCPGWERLLPRLYAAL